ncbi:MAG: His/Gly/Thr/Pro-type tRNA ligase C-terminal domain-containing protein [Ignavibacteriaceae bacterium]
MKNENIITKAEKIYKELGDAGYEVLFDDRDVTAGFKFNDADLLGMPLQIVIGEKKLKDGKCEVKSRKSGERFDVELNNLLQKINELSKSLA